MLETSVNAADWMDDSCRESKTQSEGSNHLSVDGGPNAIRGIQEFKVVTRTDGRANCIDFNVCYAHQNERASGDASRTLKLAYNPNAALGIMLAKNHAIQVRIGRSPKRMGVLNTHHVANGRDPCLKPDPANDTRWQGKSVIQSE